RPIRIIYPFAAGSGADTAWRLLAQEASKRLEQPLVFINQPGANGRLALDTVRRSEPNGYTLGIFTNGMLVVSPLIDPKNFGIEPGRDYVPVMVAIDTPLVVVATAKAPFNDLAGMVAYGRSNPGKLKIGSAGSGSGSHLGIAMFGNKAGIDVVHVPYKGSGPALAALLAGDIDAVFSDVGIKTYIESGRAKGIAVSGTQRSTEIPNLPTLVEGGVTGAVYTTWMGVLVPTGTPQAVIQSLSRAFAGALANPEVRAKLQSAGWSLKADGGSSEQAVQLIKRNLEIYRPIVEAARMSFD
ncbi:MAG: tripartite tricarboxylate transporter substrate binding protein, partial [Burkholderiaceae bacterium]|nr:tripartite tricarboxylate transporter substrate binding protein [Burkholderiaceae bacterium]